MRFRRITHKVQLYVNFPEKMEQISTLCEETGNSDTVLIVSTEIFTTGRQPKHGSSFGKEWTGKDAVIRYVYYRHREGMKGIHVLVSIRSDVRVTGCWLECRTARIHGEGKYFRRLLWKEKVRLKVRKYVPTLPRKDKVHT